MPERLAELVANPAGALSLEPCEARRLLVELAPLVRALELAAVTPAPAVNGHEPDELLDADELATALKVARRTVYDLSRRAGWKSFTVRVGGSLRFRRRGFERWLQRQQIEHDTAR